MLSRCRCRSRRPDSPPSECAGSRSLGRELVEGPPAGAVAPASVLRQYGRRAARRYKRWRKNGPLRTTLASVPEGESASRWEPKHKRGTGAEARRIFGRLARQGAWVARDMQMQVEFDPQRVVAYRQIGHANLQIPRAGVRGGLPRGRAGRGWSDPRASAGGRAGGGTGAHGPLRDRARRGRRWGDGDVSGAGADRREGPEVDASGRGSGFRSSGGDVRRLSVHGGGRRARAHRARRTAWIGEHGAGAGTRSGGGRA